jgi:hypothetical protein
MKVILETCRVHCMRYLHFYATTNVQNIVGPANYCFQHITMSSKILCPHFNIHLFYFVCRHGTVLSCFTLCSPLLYTQSNLSYVTFQRIIENLKQGHLRQVVA